jgi:hypothetical protein
MREKEEIPVVQWLLQQLTVATDVKRKSHQGWWWALETTSRMSICPGKITVQ